MNDEVARPNWWRRRNWWKIGFFTLLVVCEIMREVIVVQSDPAPKVSVVAHVGSYGGLTSATGRWTRIDGGGRMVPGVTRINCFINTGQCTETTVTLFDGWLVEPQVDTYQGTFTPEQVSYENDNPDCAHYSVRIDLKLQKVFAVRDRKDNPKNPNCKNLERRIEMTLGDGVQDGDVDLGKHFLPLLSGMRWVLGWFYKL